MEYTVQKLGKIAGISTRTLRYYDEIKILIPARINSSGYRIYGQKEIDKLQQILFYREIGVSLENIKKIINTPNFDEDIALRNHLEKLLEKREQLDLLIKNVNKTIATREGEIIMNNKEKFEGFKQNMIDDNEKKYGEEIRLKYGEKQIDKSNRKIKAMSKEKYAEIKKLSEDVISILNEAFITGDPAGELAQKAVELHRKWLSFYWDSYTKEAHVAITQMYVDDERFTAYYDKKQSGVTVFLRDAVLIYTGML